MGLGVPPRRDRPLPTGGTLGMKVDNPEKKTPRSHLMQAPQFHFKTIWRPLITLEDRRIIE
jgi:hypothetical protein